MSDLIRKVADALNKETLANYTHTEIDLARVAITAVLDDLEHPTDAMITATKADGYGPGAQLIARRIIQEAVNAKRKELGL